MALPFERHYLGAMLNRSHSTEIWDCIKERSGSFPTTFVPVAAFRGVAALELKLARMEAAQFIDPFFVDTLERIGDTPTAAVQIIRKSRDQAQDGHWRLPAGIIFHVSRCGSTLLSNLLRSATNCIVYSEPLAFNDVLMPPYGDWPDEELAGALRSVAKYLSSAAGDAPYVIKVRSWNTLRVDLFRKAFPDTPWIFLTRDPLEVAVSVTRKPPTWLRSYGAISNPFLSYLPDAAAGAEFEFYLAYVLAAFAEAVAAEDRTLGRPELRRETGLSENNRAALPIGSPKLK